MLCLILLLKLLEIKPTSVYLVLIIDSFISLSRKTGNFKYTMVYTFL